MSLGRLQNEGDLERFLRGYLLRPEVRRSILSGHGKWLYGSGAPASDLGNDGDWYLDTATKTPYVKQAGSWI